MTMRRKVGWLIMALGLPLAVTGCGGFNGSQGISPATFLAPGVVENSRPLIWVVPEPQLAANAAANPARPIQ